MMKAMAKVMKKIMAGEPKNMERIIDVKYQIPARPVGGSNIKFGIRPSKLRGQHFLINERVRDKIIAAAELTGEETVLEIGPGLGILTFELAKRAKQVLAVELDPVLAQRLERMVGSGLVPDHGRRGGVQVPTLQRQNIQVVQADALNYQLPVTNYLVVANLPYEITSPFFKRFLEQDPKPDRLVVMIQREVAERIMAKPPKTNPLAILVQLSGDLDLVVRVGPGSFSPPPKVDSAVIRLRNIRWPPEIPQAEFMRFVHRGFRSPRKKLISNLGKKQGIDPNVRPGDLTPQDWVRLWKDLPLARSG